MPAINWFHTQLGEEERASILDAFDRRRLSQGPVVAELERRLSRMLDVPFVLATPSGTAALTMALLAAGVGPGDEVVVPDLTWIATAQAAAILGAEVVLADCRADSPLVDVGQVEQLIGRRTKAIVPVHLNGKACQMEELIALAQPRGIKIVEDACKAMFVPTPAGFLGTIGDYGCFSMGMISLVNAGYGGFVATRDEGEYEKMRLIRDHGLDRRGREKFLHLGWNLKVSDLQAALAVGMLDKVDAKIAHVKAIYRRYAEGLKDNEFVSVIPVDLDAGAIPLLTDLRSPHREAVAAWLARHDIGISRFHVPLHEAPYLDGRGGDADFPNAARYAREGFVPPCGPSQPLENVDRTIELLNAWRPD